MTHSATPTANGSAIGVDVGGTKTAAGLVRFPDGEVLARRWQPTAAQRGGAALLDDVIELVCSLLPEAERLGAAPSAVGVGVAELVGRDGRILSAATIAWEGLAVEAAISAATGLPASVEADVRAAARAEASWGAGRPFAVFLYVTIGTGISSCLVLDGEPFAGARGLTGSFATAAGLIPGLDGHLTCGPPLEQYAGGPALAFRLRQARPDFLGAAPEVLARAEAGDPVARDIITSGGQAVGAAIGQLVNVLDPEAVVLGGGLGLAGGLYCQSLEASLRRHVWSPHHRELPLAAAEIGADAGFVGAALTAVDNRPPTR